MFGKTRKPNVIHLRKKFKTLKSGQIKSKYFGFYRNVLTANFENNRILQIWELI